MRPRLSLVVVARDEADRIGACLDSVPEEAERVVVVDAATTDQTASIARARGARVEVSPWRGFAAQRNHAATLARGRWLLFLDADERLSAVSRQSLEAALTRDDPRVDGFSWAVRTYWLGRPILHGRWYPDPKVRAVRRGRGVWEGAIHERLRVEGATLRLAGDILHHPYRGLGEHLRTIDDYSRQHARHLVACGVRARPWDPLVRPPLHFVNGYLLKRGFLDGRAGLAVALLGAAHTGLKWSRVWRGQP